MRWMLLCLVVVGCGGDTCDPELSGRYQISWHEVSGDCGEQHPVEVTRTPGMPLVGAHCVDDVREVTGCGIYTEGVCRNSPTTTLTYSADQVAGGHGVVSGTISVRVESRFGDHLLSECESDYTFTAVPL